MTNATVQTRPQPGTQTAMRAEEAIEPPVDGIVERTGCPACQAPPRQRCRTIIDGVDTGWTHDARVYADLGVRGRA